MQKARQRKRLRAVDKVVDIVSMALQKNGGMTTKAVERWYQEMPREEEMLPKDKYTIFDRKEKKYRKGIHSMCIGLIGSYTPLTNSSQSSPNGQGLASDSTRRGFETPNSTATTTRPRCPGLLALPKKASPLRDLCFRSSRV